MPTWGIVLSVLGYLWVGLRVLSWAMPDGRFFSDGDFIPLLLWPLVLIAGIVGWLIEFVFWNN